MEAHKLVTVEYERLWQKRSKPSSLHRDEVLADILADAQRKFPNANFAAQWKGLEERKFDRVCIERHIKAYGAGKTPPRRGNTPRLPTSVPKVLKATAQRVQVISI